MIESEKISVLISNYHKLDKPLLVYGTEKRKSMFIAKQIEMNFGKASIYSFDESMNSYSKLLPIIQQDKSPFIVLDKLENVLDNEVIIKWASGRKNIILVLSTEYVPKHLDKIFTVKKYIK